MAITKGTTVRFAYKSTPRNTTRTDMLAVWQADPATILAIKRSGRRNRSVVAALVVKFWPWIIGVPAAMDATVWAVNRAMRAADAQSERAARAEQQHGWVMQGDDRGVYGEYRPAEP